MKRVSFFSKCICCNYDYNDMGAIRVEFLSLKNPKSTNVLHLEIFQSEEASTDTLICLQVLLDVSNPGETPVIRRCCLKSLITS